MSLDEVGHPPPISSSFAPGRKAILSGSVIGVLRTSNLLTYFNSMRRRATAGPSPRARQGGLSPAPSGDRGRPPYIRIHPPFPPHLSPKIPQKIQKKKERSEEKESGEALSDSALVICRLVHLIYILLYLSTTYLSMSNLSRGEKFNLISGIVEPFK